MLCITQEQDPLQPNMTAMTIMMGSRLQDGYKCSHYFLVFCIRHLPFFHIRALKVNNSKQCCYNSIAMVQQLVEATCKVLRFCIMLYAAISHLYLTPFLGSVSEHFLRLGVLFHCAYHCYCLIVISYALPAELCP